MIISTEPLASSITFFRGDSAGEQAPIRIIQGPKTQLHGPYEPAVDLKNNELWIADSRTDALLAFQLDGSGDIVPKRIIQGAKTGLWYASGVAVDPDRNLVVCGSLFGKRTWHHNGGLFIFNRTDNGDVAPKAVIEGPTTGIVGIWHVQLYDGKIFATAANMKYLPPYDSGGYAPAKDCKGPPLPWIGPLGFVGVWNLDDNGDLPPRAIIRGAGTDLIHPSGIAIDPKNGEIFTTDSVRNGIYSFLVPSFF